MAIISIVITCYNVEKTIRETFFSAVNQAISLKYFDASLEIVIVEDCSDDKSEEIILDLLSKDYENTKINYIKNKNNIGAGASRRVGIENSIGDYILTLDGDDILELGYIADLYKNAKETSAEIVSGGMTIIQENGIEDIWKPSYIELFGRDALLHVFGKRIVFLNNKLIARRLHNLIPYCTRRYIEDSSVIIPMLIEANKVVWIPNPGYKYILKSGSLTHNDSQLKDMVYRGLCLRDLIEYFSKKPKEIYGDLFPPQSFISYAIGLSKCNFDINEVNKYKEEWSDIWYYYCHIINILTT